ncbi:lactose permease [Fusarium heterosporum]|uniref:Lactose permease n=1 Tax=Fusarium heterosporum TaxID=42747 RepID=A0A8H5T483_FUSHE|nr:lactose permease [Fusarium heterosporum]
MNGYDGSLMGSINVLPEYQDYYGLGKGGSTSTGLVFSIFQIGQMVGALFSWVCDWQGRKTTLAVSSFFVCASVVFTAVAPTLSSFIGARFLLSFFSTINTVAAPTLLVEIAPPLHRATVAGTYNTLYYIGSIIATFTLYGANIHLSGNIKWRLPLWLQILCPGLVCLGSWFLPESPRWLIAQGRDEEAQNFIIKYHANGDTDHPIVAIEMHEIRESLSETQSRSKWACFDLRSLYRSPARRYRIMLVIAMSWFGQFSGNNVSSYYLPIMVENVGITSTNLVLLLNAIYALTGWVAATVGARLHDVLGRRKMLMGSCLGMSVALAIVAATAAEYERSGGIPSSSASIAFIFIFGVIFAVGFTPMQPIYPAEVLANDMRANGMMIYSITSGCAGFVNTFAAPIAMQKIRYWFYVFFVFWDLFEFAFIYLFFVETKGRTLEELTVVFAAENPRKASTRLI